MITPKLLVILIVLGIACLGIVLITKGKDRPAPLAAEQVDALYATPLPPKTPRSAYHLGHSLVGRDMPAMLAQLMGNSYDSQLGWGTPLRDHWEPEVEINGFDAENAHDRYRDAKEALGSGNYDVFVATEMVEIRDAIKYHQSDKYLYRWADLARKANPETRIYFYESWHPTDTAEGWLERIDTDLTKHWENDILLPAMSRDAEVRPIHVIPAGQVMAHFVRDVETRGGVDNVPDRFALFAMQADGSRDPIHLSDLGLYLVALTHYAVLTGTSPVGLPHELQRADGTAADAPGADAARMMQDSVWHVVTHYPKTGVSQAQ